MGPGQVGGQDGRGGPPGRGTRFSLLTLRPCCVYTSSLPSVWLADPLACPSTVEAWSWGLGSGFYIKILGEVAHTDVTSKKEGTEERGATECRQQKQLLHP